MAFHLVITNLFIHVVPRLRKVIVNIKIAHYFFNQLNKNRKGFFCSLVFHIIVDLILFNNNNISAWKQSYSKQNAQLRDSRVKDHKREFFSG